METSNIITFVYLTAFNLIFSLPLFFRKKKKKRLPIANLILVQTIIILYFVALLFGSNSLLALSKNYHQSYDQYFALLKGIAHVGRDERNLMIQLGAIRAIIGFYLNDSMVLHFNRKVSGRNNQGQRQFLRIHPRRVFYCGIGRVN